MLRVEVVLSETARALVQQPRPRPAPPARRASALEQLARAPVVARQPVVVAPPPRSRAGERRRMSRPSSSRSARSARSQPRSPALRAACACAAASSSTAASCGSGPSAPSARWRARCSESSTMSASRRWSAGGGAAAAPRRPRPRAADARNGRDRRRARARRPSKAGSRLPSAATSRSGGSAERGDRRERLGRLRRQRSEPVAHEAALRSPGTGSSSPGPSVASARPSARAELEREERVATRAIVDAAQRRARERHAEPLAEQALNRPEAQRPDLDRSRSLARSSSSGGTVSLRCASSTPTRSAAARRSANAERGAARAVEPLDVVDRDERAAPCLASRAEELEHADGDRPRIGRQRRCVLEQERDRQAAAAAAPGSAAISSRGPAEQIGEPGERELALRLGGPRLEHRGSRARVRPRPRPATAPSSRSRPRRRARAPPGRPRRGRGTPRDARAPLHDREPHALQLQRASA